MYAEPLDLQSLDDLPDLICVGPVPMGRRVLVLSLAGHPICASLCGRAWPPFGCVAPRTQADVSSLSDPADGTPDNTIALARRTGKPIGHFRSSLPADSVLDCVLDRDQRVLWVLDILAWSSMPVSESEASFRCAAGA